MRILLLTHTFNSLAQRLFVELGGHGHEVSVELDIADAVSLEAVRLFAPDLVVAPFLKRAIPEAIWRHRVCLVVHPGIVGDRGPSSLDWAILEGEREWGVTVLQANAVMDGGDVWASRTFALRAARKSSVYRNEVTEAATEAVLEAVAKFAAGGFVPRPQDPADPGVRGRARPVMRQATRRIDWQRDPTAAVLARLRSADGFPGVLDELAGRAVHLFDATPENTLRGAPGELLARRHGAVCRATVDGAVWIGHLKQRDAAFDFKLPATRVLGEAAAALPELALPALPAPDAGTWQDIAYEEAGGIGWLHFPFYNGAMSTEQCERLREAFLAAAARPTSVLVLCGGPDFWSNGIHLNAIEAAGSPADESMRNIEAMDDLCLAILGCEDKLTIAAMQGNAGAGGVFLALAADRVWARRGVVLNPHYKGMGNLYGSEYWTYLLPRRVGAEQAHAITQNRLPVGAPEAVRLGLVDACFGDTPASFLAEVRTRASALAASPGFAAQIAARRAARAADEAAKPLAAYREEELARMRLNFYGFDPSYHFARHHFVRRVPHAWTPLHLARHRRRMWRRQELLDRPAA
jgi:putative two-component system hydrogenase maturation factor HypX/HoxX